MCRCADERKCSLLLLSSICTSAHLHIKPDPIGKIRFPPLFLPPRSLMLRQSWWKILSLILLIITFIAGFLGDVPAKPILNETIHNLYFHVSMWFAMMIFFIVSLVYSIKYLRTNNIRYDHYALEYAQTGIVF